jgi:hypothetical protein
MSEQEKYFAFIENNGKIELVYWCKTESEARKIVTSWKKQDNRDADVHYFVGEILFEPKKEGNKC